MRELNCAIKLRLHYVVNDLVSAAFCSITPHPIAREMRAKSASGIFS